MEQGRDGSLWCRQSRHSPPSSRAYQVNLQALTSLRGSTPPLTAGAAPSQEHRVLHLTQVLLRPSLQLLKLGESLLLFQMPGSTRLPHCEQAPCPIPWPTSLLLPQGPCRPEAYGRSAFADRHEPTHYAGLSSHFKLLCSFHDPLNEGTVSVPASAT